MYGAAALVLLSNNLERILIAITTIHECHKSFSDFVTSEETTLNLTVVLCP